MTAIAGVIAASAGGTPGQACRASLDALRLYGSRTSIRATSAAAFGINLHELVPEDRFDRQPYSDERFILVADVRLDNRAEMLRALGADPTAATNTSDSEILFRAWSRWQERCLDLIVGDFALAAYDRKSSRLFLARDPIGQRPLFYARHNGTLFFASMPSGILAHGSFAHDRIRAAQRLAGLEDDSRRSYFDGITRLLSGELVVLSSKTTNNSRWNPPTEELSGRTQDQLVEEMRETFDSAVAARLRRAGGPLATHLSSGFDSSAVTATAAGLSEKNDMVAFTSAPAEGLETVPLDRRAADESAVATETARYLAIDHEIVRTSEPLLESLNDHTRCFQEPVRNVLNMGWFAEIERRAAGRGARVLLVGDLGNVTFSAGGLGALGEWLHKGAFLRWWREASEAAKRPDVHWRGVLMNSFQLYLPGRVTEELFRLFLGQPRWTEACFARPELLRQLPDQYEPAPRQPAAARLAIMRGFDPGVFRKGSLAKHGIDERDPMADRRLVEFSLRLPPEALLSRGVYKPLARAVLAERVPQTVLNAPLRGYQAADWLSRFSRRHALANLEEIEGSGIVQEVIDLPRLKKAVADWIDPRTASSGAVQSFGRHVTNALAMGKFLAESTDQTAMGV